MYRKPLTIDASPEAKAQGNQTGHAIGKRDRTVIKEGKVRTYDMGGKDSTLEVAKAVGDYAS
jgi:hypothetical protein